MKFVKNLAHRLRRDLKFSASDPSNFQEHWSFISNGLRVLSFLLVFMLLYSFALLFLVGAGPFSTKNDLSDVSIERSKLENHREKIAELTNKMNAQDAYIEHIKRILKGEVPIEGTYDSVPATHEINLDELEVNPSESELILADKVKQDMRTGKKQKSNDVTYFVSPVQGVISQKFNKTDHQGIDVVTGKDQVVKACMSGTVIYAGYTRKDGYIAIVEHPGKYLSVYKHNKSIFKKNGAKIQAGDPISIVGNTGENTSGPHLHFELWYDRVPVNPEDYMQFNR